jgi:hypothetical protein
MSELNKARGTIQQSGINMGYNEGFRKAESMYKIINYCNKCGREIVLIPNSECHKVVINYLKQKGWGHIECP